jgi:hypothetical protein
MPTRGFIFLILRAQIGRTLLLLSTLVRLVPT